MFKRFYSTVPKEFIYELKTYNVHNSKSLPELNQAFKSIQNSKDRVLAGSWISPNSNQIFALWRFESLDQRKEIKDKALTNEFKSAIKPFEKDSTSLVLREYPWAPIQLDQTLNSSDNIIWDMVTYETKPGQLGSCGEGVSKAFNEKKKTNNSFGVFYSEFGTLNTILELWSYKNDQQYNQLNNSNNSNEIIKSSINNVTDNLKSNITTKLITLDQFIKQ